MRREINVNLIKGYTLRLVQLLQSGLQSRWVQRSLAIVGVIAVVAGAQTYAFYSHVAPRVNEATESFLRLLDERQDLALSRVIMHDMQELREVLSGPLAEDALRLTREFDAFLINPTVNLDSTWEILAGLSDRAMEGEDIIARLQRNMEQLEGWYHDHFGDLRSYISGPGLLLWPTSSVIARMEGRKLEDRVSFNHALYLLRMGQTAQGRAILGDLQSRATDPGLLARVLYTQGILLYGGGQYEESVEFVQDGIRQDPDFVLAKRFLEYQLSHGPGAEVSVTMQHEGQSDADAPGGEETQERPPMADMF